MGLIRPATASSLRWASSTIRREQRLNRDELGLQDVSGRRVNRLRHVGCEGDRRTWLAPAQRHTRLQDQQ